MAEGSIGRPSRSRISWSRSRCRCRTSSRNCWASCSSGETPFSASRSRIHLLSNASPSWSTVPFPRRAFDLGQQCAIRARQLVRPGIHPASLRTGTTRTVTTAPHPCHLPPSTRPRWLTSQPSTVSGPSATTPSPSRTERLSPIEQPSPPAGQACGRALAAGVPRPGTTQQPPAARATPQIRIR